MGKYLQYGMAIAKGGEEAKAAQKISDEEYGKLMESATSDIAAELAALKKNKDDTGILGKAAKWAGAALFDTGAEDTPAPTMGQTPEVVAQLKTLAVENARAETERLKMEQQVKNEEAVKVMKEYFVLPEALKPLADTEVARAFMVGQAQDMYGQLGYKQKQYALKDQELPPEEKTRLEKLGKVLNYKSNDEGFLNFVKNSAAELLGQQVQTAVDPNHNPYVTGAVAGAATAAGTAYLGPGAIATGASAAGAATLAASANRTHMIEAGHAFADLKKLKHANGKSVTVKEAAIASELIGGAVSLLDTVGLSALAKSVPVLRKFVGADAIVKSPTVMSAILSTVKRVAHGTAAEASTEGMQEIPGILATAMLQDKDVSDAMMDPENARQIVEVMQKVAAGMGALSSAGNVRSTVRDARQIMSEQRARTHDTVVNALKEGVDQQTTPKINTKEEPEPSVPPKKRVRKPSPAPEPVEASSPPPTPEDKVSSAGSVVDESVGKVAEDIPRLKTGSTKDKKTGETQDTFINIDPISTPGAVAEKPDGSLTEVTLAPESMSPKTKVGLLFEDEGNPLPSVEFEDGSRLHTPKRVWAVANATPVKLDWLTRPALLTNENTIYEGPAVNPPSITRPIIEDLDSLVESRRKAEQAVTQAGLRVAPSDEGPSDIKDVGFVITGPEGSPVAGQLVWVSSKLVGEKFKGGYASLEDRLRASMGENYEKATKVREVKEEAKAEKKNVPLSPEETSFLSQKYVPAQQKRVVNSLANQGMERTELESIVQEAAVDATRAVLKGKVRTPKAQQRAFAQSLRGITAKKYEESFGQGRRGREAMRKAGIKDVSYEAAGLENKDVTGVGATMEGAVTQEMTGEPVATKVSQNTPIKQAQRRGEFVAEGQKKPPIRTKVFTEAQKAAEAKKRGVGVAPSKMGPTIPANIRAIRARKQAVATVTPVEPVGSTISPEPTLAMAAPQIVQPVPSGKAAIKAEIKKEVQARETERRNREYVAVPKKDVDSLKGVTTSSYIGELRRSDKLVVRTNGDVTFSKYAQAAPVAKKEGGTILPTDKGTYVVAKDAQPRVMYDLKLRQEDAAQRSGERKPVNVKVEPIGMPAGTDRPIVLVTLQSGSKIPFYKSWKGTSGKTKGNWYPFFGIAENGWFMKGDTTDLNTGYGNPEIKAAQEHLNFTLKGELGPEFKKQIGRSETNKLIVGKEKLLGHPEIGPIREQLKKNNVLLLEQAAVPQSKTTTGATMLGEQNAVAPLNEEASKSVEETDKMMVETPTIPGVEDIALVPQSATAPSILNVPSVKSEASPARPATKAEKMTRPRYGGKIAKSFEGVKRTFQDIVFETGVKGPELASRLMTYGTDNNLLILKKDGDPIHTGYKGIMLRSSTDDVIKNAWIVPVGDDQFILFKPTPETYPDGTSGYAKPDVLSVVSDALDATEGVAAPSMTPVLKTAPKVGGTVSSPGSVEEQVRAGKVALEEAKERAKTTPKLKPTTVRKKKVTMGDPSIQMQSSNPHAKVSDANLGDKIQVIGAPQSYQAVLVDPATSGVLGIHSTSKVGDAGFKEVAKAAQAQSKGVATAHRVVITMSGAEGQAASQDHVVLKVVDRGFNGAKSVRLMDSLQNERGSTLVIPHLANGSMKLMGGLKSAYTWAEKALSVEQPWISKNMHEIGFAIKNFFGRRDVEEKIGMQVALDLQTDIRNTFGDKPSRQNYVDIILAAENPATMADFSPEYKAQISPIAAKMRKYFDDSQAEMLARGLNLDWKTNKLGQLQSKLEDEADPVKQQRIVESIEMVKASEFVHIPYKMMFGSKMDRMIQEVDPVIRKKRYAELQSMLAHQRRGTTIASMLNRKNKDGEYVIDRAELTPVNVIMSYAYNKGHDMAMLDIKDAIKQYKDLYRTTRGKPKDDKHGYTWIKINTPKLAILRTMLSPEDNKAKKNLWIRQDVVRAISEALGYNERQTSWDKFMSISKMSAFWNPVFLPMYNTMQALRSWTINPMKPIRTWQAFSKAVDDIGGMRSILSRQHKPYSEDYLEALRNGLASKPFSNPFQGWRDFAKAISDGTNGSWYTDAIRAFKQELDHSSPLAKYTLALPVMKSLYQASWHISWQVDELFRMASYNYLRDRGHSPREAAQVSANLQGDYASIPPKSRKILNKIFFTPTFKIATLKLYGALMHGALKSGKMMLLHGGDWKKHTSKPERRYARAAMGVIMVNMAFDLALLGLGFQRDEWGRRYVKRIVDETGKKKDFYITFASSENVVQRYTERIQKAFFDPSVSNPWSEFVRVNKWELHPVWRNAYSAFIGEGDEGRIWSTSESGASKFAKSMWYFTSKTFNLLDAIQSRTEFATNKVERERVQKTWIREYGKGLGAIYGGLETVFGYGYLTDPVEKRKVLKLKAVQKEFIREAYDSVNKTGKVDPTLKENFRNRMKSITKHYDEMKKGVVR